MYQRFLSETDKLTNIERRTKNWYKERWLVLVQCKDFMNLKVETMTADDIQRTFLMWRLAKAKSQSKKLRGATLKGDLMAISGFTSWCYRNKIRKDKLENIAKILSKKLRPFVLFNEFSKNPKALNPCKTHYIIGREPF